MAQVPSSYLENVIFDVYGVSYNNTLGQDVMSSSPLIAGVRGHLQNVFISPAGDVLSVHERDQAPQLRLEVRLDMDNDQYLVNGNYIRITYRKNKFSKAWDTVSNEQYIIAFDSTVATHSVFRTLTLKNKDQQ